jgi:AraC-like DNA-binding protein
VSLDYLEHGVSESLAPFVECLWRVDRRTTGRTSPETAETQRIVPDACPELILQRGDPFARLVARRWRRQPRAFLAGTLKSPWLLRPGRHVATIGVRFRPGAVRAFLPIDMAAAVDLEVPLNRIVDPVEAADLDRALNAATTPGAQFEVVERRLESWLAARGERPRSLEAVALILASSGRAPMARVCVRLGWTPRTLQRVFARELGISAKFFARIVRLNRLLLTLEESERAAAVDVALDLGFYDQPHMLHDTRLLAGRKPGNRRAADGDLASRFTDPDRLRRLLKPAL